MSTPVLGAKAMNRSETSKGLVGSGSGSRLPLMAVDSTSIRSLRANPLKAEERLIRAVMTKVMMIPLRCASGVFMMQLQRETQASMRNTPPFQMGIVKSFCVKPSFKAIVNNAGLK